MPVSLYILLVVEVFFQTQILTLALQVVKTNP